MLIQVNALLLSPCVPLHPKPVDINKLCGASKCISFLSNIEFQPALFRNVFLNQVTSITAILICLLSFYWTLNMLSPFLILFSNLFLFSPPPSYDLRLQFSLQFPPKASLLTTTSFLSPLLLEGGVSCVLFLGSWVSSSTSNESQNFSGVSGGLKSPQWREHLF